MVQSFDENWSLCVFEAPPPLCGLFILGSLVSAYLPDRQTDEQTERPFAILCIALHAVS